MKYKHFLAPFLNHFIQPSPPTIAKLKSLPSTLRGGVNFPHKNGPIPLWLAPHLITSKSSQPICSSKSYKYGKTKYKVSPYC